MFLTRQNNYLMENKSLEEIKTKVQEVIDLIAQKNVSLASEKLLNVNELLDDLIDLSDNDDDLVEISRYQVLLNHLQQKIENLKVEMN